MVVPPVIINFNKFFHEIKTQAAIKGSPILGHLQTAGGFDYRASGFAKPKPRRLAEFYPWCISSFIYHLVMTNIAMENHQF